MMKEMEKSNRLKHKVLMIVLIIAVLGVAFGLGLWLMTKEPEKTDVADAGVSASEEIEDVSVPVERRGQELYEKFQIGPFQRFYTGELVDLAEVASDRVKGRIEIALNNVDLVACKQDEMQECYDGMTVREKYRELFSEEVDLVAVKYVIEGSSGASSYTNISDKNGKFVAYAPEYDEIYYLEGGAGGASRPIRVLERVEENGGGLLLYERVMTVNCWPDPQTDGEGNGSACGIREIASTCGTPEFGWTGAEEGMTDEEVIEVARGKGLGLVKWIFVKDGSDYIYQGMERVNGQ